MTNFRVNTRKDRTRVASVVTDTSIATSAGNLLTVNVEPGTYYIESVIRVIPGSATNVNFAVNGTATAAAGTSVLRSRVANTATPFADAPTTQTQPLAAAVAGTTVLTQLAEIRGTVVITAAGTLAISAIAVGSAATAKVGSYLKVTRTA